MNNEQKLQHDVEQALKREPLLANTEIGVIARDGIITLIGSVDSYAKKRVAEHAAKTVKGVKAVVAKIEVNFAGNRQKTGSAPGKQARDALKFNSLVPFGQIKTNRFIRPS